MKRSSKLAATLIEPCTCRPAPGRSAIALVSPAPLRASRRCQSSSPPRADRRASRTPLDHSHHSTRRRSFATGAPDAPTGRDPVEIYLDRVDRGELERDEQQLRAVHELRKVHRSLANYAPSAKLVHLLNTMRSETTKFNSGGLASRTTGLTLPNWLSSREMAEVDGMSEREKKRALVHVLKGEEELLNLQTPTGFMLTGPPGVGKSLLLDIFFESLPTPHKARRHYHHFLLSLYHQVFTDLNRRGAELDAEEAMMQLKAADPGSGGYPWSRREEAKAQALTKGWRSVFAGGLSPSDPTLQRDFVLANIARDMLLNDGWLLAFDEVQLVDVAGASILRRVLEHFWRLGGVVVGTSNRLPDDLYQKGIQREQFLTFLAVLQSRCPVTELRSPQDYRRAKQTQNLASATPYRSWFLYGDREAFEEAAAKLFEGSTAAPDVMTVYGRTIEVPQAGNGIARFNFADLCTKALGPADYISIASRFHTVIIDHVPVLPLLLKNEARRFITLIDSLYETKTRLLCLAEARPDALFFPDAAAAAPSTSSNIAEENDEIDMSARGGLLSHPLSPERIYEGDADLKARIADPSALDTRSDDSLTSEMMTEILQDLEAPYRPNISSYSPVPSPSSSPASTSGFDMAQPSRASVLRAAQPEAARYAAQSIDLVPAFRNLAVFSGEDERFAYARAVSRLYEMDSAAWAYGAPHNPLAESARSWERPIVRPKPSPLRQDATSASSTSTSESQSEVDEEDVRKLAKIRRRGEKHDPNDGVDPASLEPPKISANHVWGIVSTWGARAGRWGRGAEAYADDERAAGKKR